MCEAASESDSVQRRPLCSAGRVSDFAKPSLVSSRRLSPVHFGEAISDNACAALRLAVDSAQVGPVCEPTGPSRAASSDIGDPDHGARGTEADSEAGQFEPESG